MGRTFDELAKRAEEPATLRVFHIEGRWIDLRADQSLALAARLLERLGHAPLGPSIRRTDAPVWDSAAQQDEARESERGALFIARHQWHGAIPGDALATWFELWLEDGSFLRWWTVDACTMVAIDVAVFEPRDAGLEAHF